MLLLKLAQADCTRERESCRFSVRIHLHWCLWNDLCTCNVSCHKS